MKICNDGFGGAEVLCNVAGEMQWRRAMVSVHREGTVGELGTTRTRIEPELYVDEEALHTLCGDIYIARIKS